jgi:hypothetical protein
MPCPISGAVASVNLLDGIGCPTPARAALVGVVNPSPRRRRTLGPSLQYEIRSEITRRWPSKVEAGQR